jgi:hypothetical protein
MPTSQPGPQSLVVKIWVEETGGSAQATVWRGSVTHVETGERVYVRDMTHLFQVIVPFVEKIGGPLRFRTRLLLSLSRLLSL